MSYVYYEESFDNLLACGITNLLYIINNTRLNKNKKKFLPIKAGLF